MWLYLSYAKKKKIIPLGAQSETKTIPAIRNAKEVHLCGCHSKKKKINKKNKNTSSAFKRLDTPESLSKRSKKFHIYANPSPKVISENITYDEVKETISETSKEYINIATDKQKVIEKLTGAGLLN